MEVVKLIKEASRLMLCHLTLDSALPQASSEYTFRGLLQAAIFIRPSFEPSVIVKSLYICRKSLFSSYTVLQMTSRASHVIVSEMGH